MQHVVEILTLLQNVYLLNHAAEIGIPVIDETRGKDIFKKFDNDLELSQKVHIDQHISFVTSDFIIIVTHCRKKMNFSIKVALSDLRQFLASKSSLKMMKNAFYFILKAFFVLKIFKILS